MTNFIYQKYLAIKLLLVMKKINFFREYKDCFEKRFNLLKLLRIDTKFAETILNSSENQQTLMLCLYNNNLCLKKCDSLEIKTWEQVKCICEMMQESILIENDDILEIMNIGAKFENIDCKDILLKLIQAPRVMDKSDIEALNSIYEKMELVDKAKSKYLISYMPLEELINNPNIMERKEALKIIAKIIDVQVYSDSYAKLILKQLGYENDTIYQLIQDSEIMKREDILKIIDFAYEVGNKKDRSKSHFNLKNLFELLHEPKIMEKGNYLEIINKASEFVSKEDRELLLKIIHNPTLMKRNELLTIIDIFSNVYSKERLLQLVNNLEIMGQDVGEILKLLGSSFFTHYGCYMLENPLLVKNKNFLEIVKLLSYAQYSNPNCISNIWHTINIPDILNRKEILEILKIMTIANNYDEEYKNDEEPKNADGFSEHNPNVNDYNASKYIYLLLSNNDIVNKIFERKDALEIIKTLASAKSKASVSSMVKALEEPEMLKKENLVEILNYIDDQSKSYDDHEKGFQIKM